MHEQNGPPMAKLVELTITFDPDTQAPGLRFDNKQIRNWDFVLGLLEMARQHANDLKRDAYLIRLQQQQQAQMEQAHLEQMLQKGKLLQA